MKTIALSFLLFTCHFNSLACLVNIAGKSTVQATITEELTGEPIPFATVVLYDADQIVMGAISDFDGRVQFDSVQFGFYTLKIQSLGYKEAVLDSVLLGVKEIHQISPELTRLESFGCYFSCELVLVDRTDTIDSSEVSQDSLLAEDIKVGEREPVQSEELVVYPNPVINILNIYSTNLISRIWIYDVSGNMVSAPEEFTNSVDLSGLSQGNYMLVAEGENGVATKSIIKL